MQPDSTGVRRRNGLYSWPWVAGTILCIRASERALDLAGRTGPNESDPDGFQQEADAEEEKESVIDVDVDEVE